MSNLYWLSDAQMERLKPFFPKSHGKPRVDDRRVLSGILFVNRNGLRWRDAPREYGPAKTLYNRWKRWSDKGIFIRMMEILTVPDDPNGQNDRTDLDQENQEIAESFEARCQDLDLTRRSPYRPAAPGKRRNQRPDRRPHSITSSLDQKLLASRAATTEVI